MPNKVNKNTTLAEILKIPKADKILAKYNLPCLGCPMAAFELSNLKIGDVCQIYGIDSDGLIRELNKKLGK